MGPGAVGPLVRPGGRAGDGSGAGARGARYITGSEARACASRQNRRHQEPPRGPVLIRVSSRRAAGGWRRAGPRAPPPSDAACRPRAAQAGGIPTEVAGLPAASCPSAKTRPPASTFPRPPRVANTPQKREGPRSRGSGTGQWAVGGGAEWPAQPGARRSHRASGEEAAAVTDAAFCGQGAITSRPGAPTFRPCSPRRGGSAG